MSTFGGVTVTVGRTAPGVTPPLGGVTLTTGGVTLTTGGATFTFGAPVVELGGLAPTLTVGVEVVPPWLGAGLAPPPVPAWTPLTAGTAVDPPPEGPELVTPGLGDGALLMTGPTPATAVRLTAPAAP